MAENRVDVCHLLLNRGADATQCDADGLTPLDYARRKNHPLAVALMTCHEGSVADFIRHRRSVGKNLHLLSPVVVMVFITSPILKCLQSEKYIVLSVWL